MAFDWFLDPATHDLPQIFKGVSKGDLVVQRIRTRLNTHLGEVWEDKRAGLPFARWASSKIPDLDEVAAYMRREVEGIPGVLRVDDVAVEVRGNAVVTSMSIISPTDDAFRVRIDLLGSSRSDELGSGAVVGSDPEPVVASPIVIITLLDTFIGL